jgi:hypothetical protein
MTSVVDDNNPNLYFGGAPWYVLIPFRVSMDLAHEGRQANTINSMLNWYPSFFKRWSST